MVLLTDQWVLLLIHDDITGGGRLAGKSRLPDTIATATIYALHYHTCSIITTTTITATTTRQCTPVMGACSQHMQPVMQLQ